MFSEITRKELLNLGGKIAKGLNDDGLKWIKSFTSKIQANNPKNALTENEYQGVNWWNLGFNSIDNNYSTNFYATKKAWNNTGASIKADQVKNGVQVFYWGSMNKKVENDFSPRNETPVIKIFWLKPALSHIKGKCYAAPVFKQDISSTLYIYG